MEKHIKDALASLDKATIEMNKKSSENLSDLQLLSETEYSLKQILNNKRHEQFRIIK